MFRKLEELVETGSLDKEVAEAIDGEITKAHTKLKDEREALSVKNKELASSFEKVQATTSELETKLSDYDDKIRTAKDEGRGEVVKQLETERQKHDELLNNLSSFEKENKRLKVQNAVSTELSKYDVMPDLRGDAEVVLSSMVSANDEGLTFGEGGLSVEEGIKGYFETRKSYLKPMGEGTGSNASDGTGGGNTKPKTELTGDKKSRMSSISQMMKE